MTQATLFDPKPTQRKPEPPAAHTEAVRSPKPGFEDAIVTLYRGMAKYADAHRERYGEPLGNDGYICEQWEQLGHGLIGLLNGETGRLDCGTLDAQIRAFIGEGGTQESTREVFAATAPALSERARRAVKSPAKTELPTSRLDDRQRELLALVRVENNVAIYTREERIPDWEKLKFVMTALGAKWKTRKGFVFEDDADGQELVRLALETGEVLDPKAAGFFPTPAVLADRVVDLAEIQNGHRVLEPSAGHGAIAAAVKRAVPSAELVCFELLPDNCKKLREAGFKVTDADFLQIDPGEFEPFDSVVMNPPFAARADIHHVRHALRFLKPGGRLVSIMSAGVKYRDDRLAREFRATVERSGGRIEDNPNGSFLESGTGVRTVMVVVNG